MTIQCQPDVVSTLSSEKLHCLAESVQAKLCDDNWRLKAKLMAEYLKNNFEHNRDIGGRDWSLWECFCAKHPYAKDWDFKNNGI